MAPPPEGSILRKRAGLIVLLVVVVAAAGAAAWWWTRPGPRTRRGRGRRPARYDGFRFSSVTAGGDAPPASFGEGGDRGRSVASGRTVRLTGTVLPQRDVTLVSKVRARCSGSPATWATEVEAGQPVVRLDATELSLALTQARAQLDAAEANLARLEAGAATRRIGAGAGRRGTGRTGAGSRLG